MHSVYCLQYLSWILHRLSTTSCLDLLLSWLVQNVVSLNRLRHSLLASVLLSCHCIPTKYAEELVKKMEMTGAKHTWLTLVGTELANVFLSVILVVSSTLSWMVLSKKLLLRLFLTSISLFRQNCRVLIRKSWIRVTLTLMLLNGLRKSKDLAGRFIKNFAKFTGNEAGKALVAAGPKL